MGPKQGTYDFDPYKQRQSSAAREKNMMFKIKNLNRKRTVESE